MGVPLNVGLYPYQRLHLRVQTIRHQLKLSVRWDEGDCAIVLETREPDTLMELHILQLHCLAACPCGRRVRERGRKGKGEKAGEMRGREFCYQNNILSSVDNKH